MLQPLRTPDPLPDFMSLRDICRKTGLSDSTIRKMAGAGEFGEVIRTTPKGKQLFHREAVESRFKLPQRREVALA